MITLLSVAAFALLFGIYGALRPRPECTGSCDSCTGDACSLAKPRTDHV